MTVLSDKITAGRLAAVLLALALAACTASGRAGSAAAPSASTRSPEVPVRRAPTPPATSVAPPGVALSHIRTADGAIVTVALFAGPVRFMLHCGSTDPGYPALSELHAGPLVAGPERHRLLAAFNGGFKLSAGVGGYEQEGHIIRPLVTGMASLVIDRSGAASIGVWGHGTPRPGGAVVSIRQNLPPLVLAGQPSSAVSDWQAWGATLGGGEYVARSALGQNAAGQLLFAGSMSATPGDLAAALVRAGVRVAMELDINPEWVQLDTAGTPGGTLSAAIPGQVRPADQYLTGWTRDFITVLAPG